ncbi:MAG: glycosyl transferase family 1 [Betaproteobacteria bacterium RIFCSPLOWO2_12_FULL_63_13]|nr:MAG: glycosyl transferase family 1 [Betaproteobacteria bacterium RIFCSPLOWO2_02_FULL_63_19]OGA53065.1 MAG: glycosyl transferase family 1 [Betaproteobacteria bacterium RIFCSPLOWO2_12_FULL_63_13]
MRILHTESSCGWGGQELRILDESRGMVGRGHTVTIAAPVESRLLAEARRRGLEAIDLPIARKSPRGVLSLYRWLRNHPVDVINTHSSTDSWLTAVACAISGRTAAIVRTRHISAAVPENRATRWLYVSATHHVVTTGEALRRQLIDVNGFPADRVTSVPTGVDTRRFAPGERAAARRALDLPPRAFLLGIVATLRSWKGHRYLLETFATIARGDCMLVIVGDGPQRANIESQIAELNLADRVIMAGNQSDVLPWLHAIDLFVLPSYANEGVPQALVQAMLCALPCVTTDVGSIGEAARDGETALVVPARDVVALGQALQRLIGSEELRNALGRAARAHCENRFSVAQMLDRMEDLFQDAVRKV